PSSARSPSPAPPGLNGPGPVPPPNRPPAGWVSFTSKEFQYSIAYPTSWSSQPVRFTPAESCGYCQGDWFSWSSTVEGTKQEGRLRISGSAIEFFTPDHSTNLRLPHLLTNAQKTANLNNVARGPVSVEPLPVVAGTPAVLYSWYSDLPSACHG